MTVTWEERQERIEKAKRVTVNQARYLVDARYERDDEEGRRPWRERWDAIGKHEDTTASQDVTAMINELKEIETISARADRLANEAKEAAKTEVPTEEGFYRNPETGELYRIKRSGWDLIISKYSETGGPRRLLADGSKLVKGTWKRYNAFQSRLALSWMSNDGPKIKKSWKIDIETLAVEYAYNFCPFHNGPLTDGVSVILGYGEQCAAKHGLPWGEEAAQAVLAARRASQEG
jgi:hypothetical protein